MIDNVLFPIIKTIHGFTRETVQPTNIITNSSGREYRILRSNMPRFMWTYQSTTIEHADMLELESFWADRGGRLRSFKFQDPNYQTFNDAILSSAGGQNWYLRIPHTPSTAGDHRVFNFDSATTATVDSIPTSINSASLNTSGEPIITITGTTGSEVVRITGNCYLSARFDVELSWSLSALNLDNSPFVDTYQSIILKEVFESTL